jgi:hypothetical protein
MTQRRGGGGIPLGFNSVNRLNFLLPQRPDGGTMTRVTASQVSFSTYR